MATEADKTNTAVIATVFAVGAAAMLGGSAALVSLARSEMQEYGEAQGTFADLNSIEQLREGQHEQLMAAKLPIDEAEGLVLSQIKNDPAAASPWTAVGDTRVADAGVNGADAGAPSGEATEEAVGPDEQPADVDEAENAEGAEKREPQEQPGQPSGGSTAQPKAPTPQGKAPAPETTQQAKPKPKPERKPAEESNPEAPAKPQPTPVPKDTPASNPAPQPVPNSP